MPLGQNRQDRGKLSLPGPELEYDCKHNENGGEGCVRARYQLPRDRLTVDCFYVYMPCKMIAVYLHSQPNYLENLKIINFSVWIPKI